MHSCLDNSLGIYFITDHKSVVAVPLALLSQSKLRHCTSRPIFTARQRAGRPVSIYCCSFSLHFICFVIIFYDRFVIMAYIVYLVCIFVIYDIRISIMCILLYYHTQDCIRFLTSYFGHQNIVFSRMLF